MKLDFYKTYATAGEHSYLSLGVVGDYVSKLLELDVKDGDNLQSETRNIDFFKFGWIFKVVLKTHFWYIFVLVFSNKENCRYIDLLEVFIEFVTSIS